MAGGYAATTGRGQAVLVHADAGTAIRRWRCTTRSACVPARAADGRPRPFASRREVPAGRDLLMRISCKTPTTSAPSCGLYNRLGMADLPDGRVAKELVARACSGDAVRIPKGPVFLTLPREVLASGMRRPVLPAYPLGALSAGGRR